MSWHKLAPHSQREYRFSKIRRFDVVGLMKEKLEVSRSGLIGEAGQRRAGERRVPRLPFLLLRLQPITQRHQLIHLRHDPLLLGEGRERKGDVAHSPIGTSRWFKT